MDEETKLAIFEIRDHLAAMRKIMEAQQKILEAQVQARDLEVKKVMDGFSGLFKAIPGVKQNGD